MRLFFKQRPKLNLALQGGGAHGAFTWGVLDRLLADDEIDFGWISGTSAGAFNAVALAHGLATGGRDAARDALGGLWSAVEETRVPDLVSLNPFLSTMARSTTLSGVFSPYSFNPLGFDPLRKILNAHIDFAAIRANKSINVMVAATDVASGRARIFQRDEITVDTVLASACLPTLHHAVEIGGRTYWDGGFSANPDLLTLARNSPVADTLLILLNPLDVPATPKTAAGIEDRVNTITFNQPLMRDVQAIVSARHATRQSQWFPGMPRWRAPGLAGHRFHMIEAGNYTAELGARTKVTPNPEVLKHLNEAGHLEATSWLANNKTKIGRRETVDLEARFLAPLKTVDIAQQPDHNVETPEPVADVEQGNLVIETSTEAPSAARAG